MRQVYIIKSSEQGIIRVVSSEKKAKKLTYKLNFEIAEKLDIIPSELTERNTKGELVEYIKEYVY